MRGTIVLAGIVLAFVWAGCSKDSGCKPVPVENEKAIMESFNNSIGMVATRHSTGFYYQILANGSTNKPQQSSTVFVKYRGTLLDGTEFDKQTNPGATGFLLNNLIDGWKYAIPLIGKGGKIIITVPSALGYGCQGQPDAKPPIPPNSPLYFEIELFDFF